MIIDSHQHAFRDTEEQIRTNKSAGVGKVWLFPTRIHPETANNINEFSAEFAKLMTNLSGGKLDEASLITAIDETASIAAGNPVFFTGFGVCPSGMDFDSTARWIETHVTGKNLVGIGEITFAPGNAASIENIVRYAHEHATPLPLWIHTFNPVTSTDISTIVALADRYPRARIVLGHGGGYHWLDALNAAKTHRNLWIDLSAQFSTFPVKFHSQEIPDRILFSSDLPFDDPALRIETLRRIITDRNILDMALGENAEALLVP